ncbi:glycosyltransferase [Exiguobacterium sp.]|uniref:glycosyltransferase family 2 protein n=1 Tax=Exiguobacterium sp. TaxID=44751 RepID=UPI00263B6624|nr:glycosyltransferase [Exiguobacterium sp.]MCC5891812.1 glycosyltransferase [Exiguobacterium sp.]
MANLTTLVSLIVPIYNTSTYLHQCLDSLVHQTYPHLEIICINDGSTDDSLDIARTYVEDPRVQVIDQMNRGCTACRARGLDMANGEYVMFIDSDDWLDLEAIRVLVEHADREQADVVMGTYVREYENRALPKQIFPTNYLSFDEVETKRYVHRRLFGLIGEELAHPETIDALNSNCITLYRRTLLDGVPIGGPHGTFVDLYFQIHALERCKRFVYVDYPVYHYRKTNMNSESTVYKQDLVTSRINFFHFMMDYIERHDLGDEYRQALSNRIALSMIGIGLNELASPRSVRGQAKALRDVLRQDDYRRAYAQFDLSHLDLKWKTFFALCKHEQTLPLIFLLRGVDFMRRRV